MNQFAKRSISVSEHLSHKRKLFISKRRRRSSRLKKKVSLLISGNALPSRCRRTQIVFFYKLCISSYIASRFIGSQSSLHNTSIKIIIHQLFFTFSSAYWRNQAKQFSWTIHAVQWNYSTHCFHFCSLKTFSYIFMFCAITLLGPLKV